MSKKDFMEMELVGGGLSREESGKTYGGVSKCICRVGVMDTREISTQCRCLDGEEWNYSITMKLLH